MHIAVSFWVCRAARLIAASAILALPGAAQSSPLTTLYSFAGGINGANPSAGVIFGPGGGLYGTTFAGACPTACIRDKFDA